MLTQKHLQYLAHNLNENHLDNRTTRTPLDSVMTEKKIIKNGVGTTGIGVRTFAIRIVYRVFSFYSAIRKPHTI